MQPDEVRVVPPQSAATGRGESGRHVQPDEVRVVPPQSAATGRGESGRHVQPDEVRVVSPSRPQQDAVRVGGTCSLMR